LMFVFFLFFFDKLNQARDILTRRKTKVFL